MNNRRGGVMTRLGSLRMSELLPIRNRGGEITAKGYLGPVAVTLLFFALLDYFSSRIDYFCVVLGVYLSMAMVYVVYRLCGKRKSPLVLFGSAAATMALLKWSPILGTLQALLKPLSGPIPEKLETLEFLPRLWVSIFGIGVSEELLKAIPVLAVLWLARYLQSGARDERYAVSEPLDGIIFGAASAAGFAFLETVFVYALKEQTVGAALQSEIVRFFSAISGHIAYSGYFGYFIGLSVLRPQHKWTLLIVGWLSSSVLHGLWDASGNLVAYLLIGGLSYVALIGAVLKARQISPSRAGNFATQLIGAGRAATPEQARAGTGGGAAVVAKTAVSPAPGLSLRIGARTVALTGGARLAEHQLAGLTSQAGDGCVAVVDRKPADPSVLGLKNLSTSAWTVKVAGGERRELPYGKSVRLDRGTEIDFGVIVGRVE